MFFLVHFFLIKILESSQTLLNVLKRESHTLRNKVDTEQHDQRLES